MLNDRLGLFLSTKKIFNCAHRHLLAVGGFSVILRDDTGTPQIYNDFPPDCLENNIESRVRLRSSTPLNGGRPVAEAGDESLVCFRPA